MKVHAFPSIPWYNIIMKEIHFRNIGNYELEPMACYIKKFTPSFYMGMHNHPCFEMMYASKGNFNLEIMQSKADSEDKPIDTITVHQGELIFLDSFLFHRLQIEENEVIIYNVELQPRTETQENPFGIGKMFAVSYAALIERTSLKSIANNSAGYTIVPNLSKIDFSFRELIYTMMKTNTCAEDACCVRAHILLLFMEIAKSLTLFEQNSVHYIKKIQLYIKHHLNQKIRLDDIAEEVGYHKSYVAAQFKNYTGKTIMQTVNELRVSKSLLMLRDTSLSVAEIARQVGFPSYAQMVHEFNKAVGMPPTACRKVFLNDEMDYDSPQYNSIAIRISEEDRLLDDEAFTHAYYKKGLKSKSKNLLGY